MHQATPDPSAPTAARPATGAAGDSGFVEPPGLVRAFLAHPPQDFLARTVCGGAPAFTARFDLMTTAEPGLRRFVQRLPGYRYWRRVLEPRTLFVGTTVTEYAALPSACGPHAFAKCLAGQAAEHAFTIVKDLPCDGALVGANEAARADAFAQALERRGFVLLEGQALAYVPIDFADTDAFLARQPRGRRRDIRRKLRTRERLRVEQRATGDPWLVEPTNLARIYAMYEAVYAQSEIHFDRLSRDFFADVLADGTNGGVLFLYYADGDLVGWNLCFAAGTAFVDKYIGLAYPAARELNLYCVSWVQNLEYARTHGFRNYVAGWTDPEIKAHLGARFTMTRHAVYPRSRVLRFGLRHLARLFESDHAFAEAARASDRP